MPPPPSRFPLRAALALLLLPLASIVRADGPQHWGFGQGYLAGLVTREDGSRDLVVWSGPARARDARWLVRWRHEKIAGPQQSAWLAVGDFR
ncbi:MAG: hypothetical protein HUU15_14920, partial [Candidatus Brocadiae bacterium]|nr:hypothetical protein [Candidatus Brocadiia bacterium]